jgi:hypothetical protein
LHHAVALLDHDVGFVQDLLNRFCARLKLIRSAVDAELHRARAFDTKYRQSTAFFLRDPITLSNIDSRSAEYSQVVAPLRLDRHLAAVSEDPDVSRLEEHEDEGADGEDRGEYGEMPPAPVHLQGMMPDRAW